MRDFPRLREISAIMIRHGMGDLIQRLGIPGMLERAGQFLHMPVNQEREDIPVPVRVRQALEDLGPSFIKLGQVLATRVDVFPAEWITEFERLQSDVPPVPFAELEGELSNALGRSPYEIFADLDPIPVGSASIAQVHRARLPDGEQIILKIRRPGIVAKIEADLRILRQLAKLVELEFPETRRYQPTSMVDEFARSLMRELDLAIEARNVDRFRQNFAAEPSIVIPEIHWQWTSSILNVQSYIDGIPGNNLPAVDAAGLDRRQLASDGADAVLKMILIDGYFHADPHPGNVFYLRDGRIAFIDFGMVGRLPHYRRDEIVDLLASLARRDERGILDVLIEWTGDATVNENRLASDIADFIFNYEHLSLREIHIGQLLTDMIAIMRQHSIALPPDLTLLFKALITLEGLGRQLDPDFQMLDHITPFVKRVIIERYEPTNLLKRGQHDLQDAASVMMGVPRDLAKLVKDMRRGKIKVDLDMKRIDTFGLQISKSANRLTLGIVTGCLIIASAIVMTLPFGPRIFGMPVLGLLGFCLAFINSIWVAASIWRSEHQ
ncbi:MAG: ubiquinone biosynthesis protein [Pseudomonadota bacterium]|nr:ubiquinone biosynthesis protein [Pseudomonadota bacterium]